MTIPTELVYLLIAIALGMVVYRFVTGHGGTEIVRPDYAGLPVEGRVEVRHHQVRWSAAGGDSFVAAWQVGSGQFIVMRVVFDGADEEEPDRGHIDLSIDKRKVHTDVSWTDKIRDRSLRSDVEGILKALAREAKRARSDKTRLAGAKSVGDSRKDVGGG
jgi:hypothetical protein